MVQKNEERRDLYLAHIMHAHVFIASRLAGVERRLRNASLAPCLGADDIPMAGLMGSLKLRVYQWASTDEWRARPVSFRRSLLERAMVDLELQMSEVEMGFGTQ